MRFFGTELVRFFVLNVRASYFGIFLLSLLFFTHFFEVPFVSRYDFIFIAALGYQLSALLLGFEKPKEFVVIFSFHVLATLMELFKTHPSIGSWHYPEVAGTVFVLATVPLFAGFLYSAVGSYISRAIVFMQLSYTHFPKYIHLWILSFLIYINFFTHHFVYDIRYVLIVYILVLFYKTKIFFTLHKKTYSIPFLLSALLTAVFVWVAENAGTFTSTWLYPSQSTGWHLVPLGKIESWFLLLVLSFALVSLLYRERLYGEGKTNTKENIR